MFGITEEARMADFYVAVDGDDGNPGTGAKPFRTFTRAQEAVRKLKKSTKEVITVFVRRGTYYLNEPLVFTPEDSVTEEQAIIYAAYLGEKPTISGGRKIVGEWRPFRDGIMMCSLPEVKAGKLSFTQLFVNGKRQIRARYPNFDPNDPIKGGYIYAKGRLPEKFDEDKTTGGMAWIRKRSQGARGILFDPKTFTTKKLARSNEVVIHIFPSNYNCNLQWQVKDIDWDRNIIWLGRGGFQRNTKMFPHGYDNIDGSSRFYIENVFEELDAPGEWYLDKEEGILFYRPEGGTDISKADVVAPVLKHVVEFRGSQDEPVSNITLSGFRITHTTSTFLEPYEVISGGDWSIHRGGAVFVEGAVNCTIEKCFFDAVGGNGVFINNFNRRIKVLGNKFTEAGDSAVCMVGSAHLTVDSIDMFPSESTVSNNLIHDCGIFGKQTAGVFSAISKGNTISHNEIYNMPRAGICFNDGFGGGHLVEYNKVYNVVRETSDHGPFNSWGRERYWCLQQAQDPGFASAHEAGDVRCYPEETTIIRNNYFHCAEKMGGWGIDLDDGSCNYHVYNNLCLGVCIKLRDGDYRTVENNIIVYPRVPEDISVGYAKNHDKFLRNIIITKETVYRCIWHPPTAPWLNIDYNLFFNPQQEFSAESYSRDGITKKYSLAEWQALGHDTHSLFADPMFVDPANGDYRVKPQSPALKLGFKNFDTTSIGLLPEFLKHWELYL